MKVVGCNGTILKVISIKIETDLNCGRSSYRIPQKDCVYH